jgi:beta-galactosidase
VFDPGTGRLLRLGGIEVEGPRLDLWRAPTDNDHGLHGEEALEPLWRRVGLHRLQHRVDRVALEGDELVVRSRVAPAATHLGMATTYRWSAVPGGLRLEVRVVPEGDWPCPLQRLGRPQENGNRRDVRWARIGDGHGTAIRLEGEPTFDLTVRPWTSEHLDQARHPTDLRPDDRVWVNLDHAQQGIGSASCGPGVLPAYRLDPARRASPSGCSRTPPDPA